MPPALHLKSCRDTFLSHILPLPPPPHPPLPLFTSLLSSLSITSYNPCIQNWYLLCILFSVALIDSSLKILCYCGNLWLTVIIFVSKTCTNYIPTAGNNFPGIASQFAMHFWYDCYTKTGTDPGFSFRGGAKDYVPAHTLRARNRTHFWQGVQGPLKGPGSSRVVFNALSRYLSLIFMHSEKKIWLKKHCWSNFRGGACLLPPWIRHCYCLLSYVESTRKEFHRNVNSNFPTRFSGKWLCCFQLIHMENLAIW